MMLQCVAILDTSGKSEGKLLQLTFVFQLQRAMGFEQLAALKEQLKKQKPAPAKPAAKPSRERRSKPPVEAKPVDPVVLAIGKLQKRFPHAFPKNPAPKVPLKVGIFDDLKKHAQVLGLSEPELRDAMRTWCRGNRYWHCLVEGAVRVDLEGGEAGHVSAGDAARARRLKANRASASRSQAPKTSQASQTPPASQTPQAPDTSHAEKGA
jgi:ProP effector